jgi:hypothetical protein
VTTEGRIQSIRKVSDDGVVSLRINYHGTGTGPVSGTNYVLTFADTVIDEGAHYTQTYRAQLISKGRTDNMLVMVSYADGVLTSPEAKAVGKCVG